MLIGSTLYIIYEYHPSIGGLSLFKRKKKHEKIIDIIDNIISGESASSTIIERIPNKKMRRIITTILPDIEIKIKADSFTDLFKKRKSDPTKYDERLITSILKELDKFNK